MNEPLALPRFRFSSAVPILLLLVCVVACGGCGTEPPAARANLLLITLDTVRADRLGCYGYGGGTSPALDALAARSYLFERATSSSAVTPVSHGTILTGLEPYHHGLRSLHGGTDCALPDSRWTLAELLRDHGYATGGFVSAFPATRHYGLDQGFQEWDQQFESNDGTGLITERGVVNTGSAQRRADETTDRVLPWLARTADTPFFAWVHYFDAHDPVLLPPLEQMEPFRPDSVDRKVVGRAIYDAEIAFVDTQIARLLDELERLGTRDRTVIVVVADHGQGLGDHGWWGHSILFQEQIHVPLILSVPGGAGGRRLTAPVRTVDLLPTLVELLGLEPPAEIAFDGKSLAPLLEGGLEPPRVAYAESINDLAAYYDTPFENRSLYSIQDGRWKLIAHREEGEYRMLELYDLAADPGETSNLREVHPETTRKLIDDLERRAAILDNPPLPELDDETREQLRSLGYVQ